MPTTPTVRNYDIPRVHQGPGDLWYIGVAGPADGATPQLTIAYDFSPDATAHPTAVHLGGTETGITTVVKPKFSDIKFDQFDGPVDRYITEEAVSMEATLAQLDPKIMQYVHPIGVFSTVSSNGQITFGGPVPGQVAPGCFAMISRKRRTALGYYCTILFLAHGTVGLNFMVGREKPSGYKATFEALSDVTRTLGRMQGVFYEGTAPAS